MVGAGLTPTYELHVRDRTRLRQGEGERNAPQPGFHPSLAEPRAGICPGSVARRRHSGGSVRDSVAGADAHIWAECLCLGSQPKDGIFGRTRIFLWHSVRPDLDVRANHKYSLDARSVCRHLYGWRRPTRFGQGICPIPSGWAWRLRSSRPSEAGRSPSLELHVHG